MRFNLESCFIFKRRGCFKRDFVVNFGAMRKLLLIFVLLGSADLGWAQETESSGMAEMTCKLRSPNGGAFLFRQKASKISGTWYEKDANTKASLENLLSSLQSQKLANGKCRTELVSTNKTSKARISLEAGREFDQLEEFMVNGKNKKPKEPGHELSCFPNATFVALINKSCKQAKVL